jgi:NTP pyrophosphatase (non-canonical NTP hydrolase)
MKNISEAIQKVLQFRDERDWKQFHNPKDVAISLDLEAAELLEHFQWLRDEDCFDYIKSHREAIGDELADILYWLLILSNDLEIDLFKALERKLIKNDKKYPISKSKGRKDKYTEL